MTDLFCEILEKNKKLVHISFDYNNFNYQECVRVAESLETNHTLYGFHFAGHFGYVDNLGFFIVLGSILINGIYKHKKEGLKKRI